MTTIAIIGAGLAGAAAGRSLQEAGHQVTLFDKGRGPGGRMSTRRMETALGTVRLDHGAQFFTVRGEGLTKAVVGWTAAGACAPWQGKLIKIDADGTSEPLGGDDRYVGVGGMNQVVKAALKTACSPSCVAATKPPLNVPSRWPWRFHAPLLGWVPAVQVN